MKFVMINGHSCGGKSTVVKNIISEKERYYQLSYDSLKWLFSRYNREIHGEDVRKLVRDVCESVCSQGYNIVCDSAVLRETRKALFAIAKKYGYEIIEINLEADYEVLERRFDERVADALKKPESKVSNQSKERFKKLYEIYEVEKNPNAVTFRTDTLSASEITAKILTLL